MRWRGREYRNTGVDKELPKRKEQGGEIEGYRSRSVGDWREFNLV